MEPFDPAAIAERSSHTRGKSKLAEFVTDPVVVCVLLALVTLALYWPAIRFEFVNFDDHDYFTKNARVQNGLDWGGLVWAFRSGVMSNWHPLTWLSFMLDVTLSGDSPEGPHFTNIFLHAANSALLFLWLRRLTGAHWRSVFVAGLFALHPLNVESVAWVSERKNVLSTFFWLLTLLCYAKAVASGEWRVTWTETAATKADSSPATRHSSLFYWLALLFFALGLMSKPMLVTLPFVLLLLDYWPLGRVTGGPPSPGFGAASKWRVARIWHLVLEKIPFFWLSAIACVVTFLVQQQGKAVQSLGRYPVGGRIENAFVSICRYLGKTFWPEQLTVFYPHPGHWPWTTFVTATVFVLTVCLIVLWQGRRSPFLVTGWFWFLGTLIPVIGLVQVGQQAMADRYAYVPLIGVFIIVSWAAAEFYTRWKPPGAITAIAAGMVLAACAMRTRDQLGCWQNDVTLFRHAIALTPDYVKGHLTLGYYFEHHGRPDEAIVYYRSAIGLDPDNLTAHVNLGAVLESCGRTEEAVKEFREAVRIAPGQPEVHYNLGCELVRSGRRSEAIEQFTEALRLRPGFVPAEQGLRELGVLPEEPAIIPPAFAPAQ